MYELSVQNTEQTQRYTRHNLVKKYVDGETKEERKTRKALEKVQKSVEDVQILPQKSVEEKYYVLCLKHGTKYSSDYVNVLHKMVKRNCTLDFEMVCLTDNSQGINPDITILPLPKELTGWWCKPYMFSSNLPLTGKVLYMDLDVVISNNVDKLFEFTDGWATIRDFTRKMRPTWRKYNSSVVLFEAGSLSQFWDDFVNDQKKHQRKFHGDQDWLYDVAERLNNPAKLFPDNWIMSWKWEIRQSKDLNYKMPKGKRTLRTVENVKPPKDCSICVFHGDPNPEHCEDPWVKENWK